jgi:hypothetical protein
MKKLKFVMLLVLLLAILFVIWKFVYLEITHYLKIFQEYEVYSKRKTSGTFWIIIHSDEMRIQINKKYQIEIPTADFNKNYLLMSDGRKIREIKYKFKSRYQWQYKFPMGVETFDDKYCPNKIFIYRINRIYIHRKSD